MAGLGDASGLQLTDGADTLSIDAGASTFSFPTPLPSGTPYVISIATQPVDKVCTVAAGFGTIESVDVANAVVTCADQAFQLGGVIQGLSGSGLVLADGVDTLTIDPNAATFTMPTPVTVGGHYEVTVQAQPAGLACAVNNGAGVMPASDVAAVSVVCTDRAFALGGSIKGLGSNPGLVLANGPDLLNVDAAATTFRMPAPVPYSSAYAITVQRSPAGLTCSVMRGSGTMTAGDITNVAITCADQSYSIGGTISGLTVPGLVLANGPDLLTIPANATSFTMPSAVAFTGPYALVVQSQPTNFTCSVGNGTGTMDAGAVTNIAVTCSQNTFTIGGSISGLTTNGLILSNGSDTLKVLANAATFTMPAPVANGASYDLAVVTNPAAVHCTVSNGTGVAGAAPVSISISCGAATLSTFHSFAQIDSPAWQPVGNLIQGKDGNFYGMTSYGGSQDGGAAFKLTPDGNATILWSFEIDSKGTVPSGGLIQGRDGNFYGTTFGGGASAGGTAFKLTPEGVENVLWSFGNGTDGRVPVGHLLEASDGNFYGATNRGGTESYGRGTVFRLTPSGTETVLTSFAPSECDGEFPLGSLIQGLDGNLYGTTNSGGLGGGGGTVFRITLDGVCTSLARFAGDGGGPFGAIGDLIQASDGNFYGATEQGAGNGTVFRLTPTGVLTILERFENISLSGGNPAGGLIQANDGNLYGVTTSGGAYGHGVLYRLTLAGEETVLYSLEDVPVDGVLQAADGSLYFMTLSGGTYGFGTVVHIE